MNITPKLRFDPQKSPLHPVIDAVPWEAYSRQLELSVYRIHPMDHPG